MQIPKPQKWIQELANKELRFVRKNSIHTPQDLDSH